MSELIAIIYLDNFNTQSQKQRTRIEGAPSPAKSIDRESLLFMHSSCAQDLS
jgi:hypothetical protein